MSGTWVSRPAGIADLTGQTINGLRILGFAGRHPSVRWQTRCEKCGTSTTELHSTMVNGGARCRNVACTLGRLQPAKVSAHERWLNSVDEPVPAPQPTPAPKQPMAERPSDEYVKYRAHAILHDWVQVITWEYWKTLPDHGRQFLLDGIEKDIRRLKNEREG